MKVILLTTLPNKVATTLKDLLGSGLCVVNINNVNNLTDSVREITHTHNPHILISYRCPYIIPIDIISTIPLGAYNIHPSLLPKYRGLNPWEEIFAKHETESGVTIHKITEVIDGGPIVSQRKFNISSSDTITSARDKADNVAAELVKDLITSLM